MEPDHQRVESPADNDDGAQDATPAAIVVVAADDDNVDDGLTEPGTSDSTSLRLDAFCATFPSSSDKSRKSSGKPIAGWLESRSDPEIATDVPTTRKARSPLEPSQGSSSRVLNASTISTSKKSIADGKEIHASVRKKSIKRAHRTPVPNIKPIISITPVPSSPVHRSSPLGLGSNGAWDLSSSSGVCLKMPSTGPLDLQARSRPTSHAVDDFLRRSPSPCQVAPIALTKKAGDTPTVLDLATNGKIEAEFGISSENDSQSGDSSDGSVGSEISDISSKNDYESDGEEISRQESNMISSLADKNTATRLTTKKPGFQQAHQSLNPLSNLEIISSIALALDMSSSVTVTPVQSVPSPPLSSPLNLSMKRPSLINDHGAGTPATAHSSSSIYAPVINRGAKRGPKPKHLRGLSALTEEENQLRLRQEELKVQLETQLRQQQFQLKLARKAALYDRHATTSPPEIHIQTSTSSQGGKHCIVTKNASSASGSSTRHLSPSLLALSQGLSARSVSLLPPESTSAYYSSSHSKSSGGFGRAKNPNGVLSLIPIESTSAEDLFGAMKKSALKLKNFATKTSSDDDDSSGAIGSSIDSMDTTCSASGSSDNDSDSSSSDTETSSGRGRKREYSSEGSSPAKKARQLVISDERELRIPLEHGFSGARGEVVYFAPCGKKLKTYPEVVRYLEKNSINDIGRENFSFSAKHNVGEYLEPQGNEEYLEIGEAEVVARIEEFRARKGRRYIPVAMRRKMEDKHRRREESRQRRRLEQQGVTMAQSQRGRDMTTRKKRVREKAPFSAREARKLKAAEARLQKEHVRFLRQQEKFEKQEQLRIEKEVKAHQAQEARKKRQELLEKQRMEETEREMKRLQAVVLREQELQKRREMLIMVDLERERRRQHMLLVKALETRKRQEERERMKEERLEEKKLIRERKMEERKLEMHLLREMRKPVDDMELKDSKPLPVFNRISGIKLTGQAFADILMVYEFLNNFGETLGFDMEGLPSLSTLQIGLLSDSSCEEEILSVLHHLLTCAIEDPGIPGGPKGKTALNQHLKDVDITSNTVSEVLRIFILATEGSACKYLEWLSDKPFMALTATQKASILAHLCNELLCSRVICRQIDSNIDLINNMRRDKWMIEGKVRKLKMVHAKKMARQQLKVNLSGYKNLCEGDATPKKTDNSAEEDIGNNNSDNEQSDGSHETGRLEAEEPEEEPGVTIEDLGKKIEKMTKQQNLCRRKLMRATQQLRVSSLGQDRFRRRYWILPTAGGVFVEGLQSSELPDDQPMTAVLIDQSEVKGETSCAEDNSIVAKDCAVKEETKEGVNVCEPMEVKSDAKEETKMIAEVDAASEVKSENNNFLVQVPDEQGKLDDCTDESVLLTAKLTTIPRVKPAIDINASADKKDSSTTCVLNPSMLVKGELKVELSDSLFDFQKKDSGLFGPPSLSSSAAAATFNHYYYPGLFPVPQCQISAEQILKTFGTKAPEEKLWFSILPRMPCDETSLTRLQPTEDASNNPDIKPDERKWAMPVRTPNSTMSKTSATSATTAPAAISSSTPITSSMPQYPPIQFSPFYFHGNPSAPFGAAAAQMAMFNGCLSPFLMSNVYGTSSAAASSSGDTSTALNSHTPYVWSPALMQQYAALRDLQQQQYSEPRPIPNEFRKGWWRVTDVGQVKAIIQVLHVRGIREKMLQMKLQKYLDFMSDACNKGGQLCASLEITDVDCDVTQNADGAPDSDDDVGWNRDVVRRLEISILEQVESLEEKVAGASMQLKQWKLPPKVTDEEGVRFYVTGEDSVSPSAESNGLVEEVASSQRYNALSLAKERLLGLEAAIERRYMKPPLGHILNDVSLSSMTSHHQQQQQQQHNHSRSTSQNNGNDNGVTRVDAAGDAPVEEDDIEESPPSPIVEEVSKGLLAWRMAVKNARSSSQLAVCLNYLEGSVAWDRSIMKASCQFCNSGDNEAMLLLCDGCDKGYHTYCFKPKMDSIPDGDWFCYECLNKATGNRLCLFCGKKGKNLCLCDLCPKAYHTDCLDPPLARVPKTKWHCPQCNNNNGGGGGGGGGGGAARSTTKHAKAVKARKSPKEKRDLDSSSEDGPKKQDQRSALSKAERAKDRNKSQQGTVNSGNEDMEPCKVVLTELETHADAWPFLLPVNTKQFPSYKKVIRRPMDMSTVHSKLDGGAYRCRAEFATDVRLVFDNCETFNEDDSPVGKAGHNLRAHFETLWNDVN